MPTWEQSYPQAKPLSCKACRHLRVSGLKLAIYDFIGGYTYAGEGKYRPFFLRSARLAKYFGAHESTISNALKALRQRGWLEYANDPMAPKDAVRYVEHDGWAKKHPGQCLVPDYSPWQIETDPLVGKIWALAGGKLRVMGWQISRLRANAQVLGLDDAGIEKRYAAAIDEARTKRDAGAWSGTSPRACFTKLCRDMQSEAEESRRALR